MKRIAILAGLALGLIPTGAWAITSPIGHSTDGTFGAGEWTGPNVSKSVFAPVVVGGVTQGGSTLYVEHISPPGAPGTLYLMYDWTANTSVSSLDPDTFFDVFFQVGDDDYGVHIKTGSDNFLVYEKPHGTVSPLDAQGSLDFSSSPWHSVDPLELTSFHSAIGFDGHPMAEFELSVNTRKFFGPAGHEGFYDPAPAFWSASGKAGSDPPISSAIFQLNPDGSTTVNPVFGPNGAPALQPQDVVAPLPSTALASGALLLGLGLVKRRTRVG